MSPSVKFDEMRTLDYVFKFWVCSNAREQEEQIRDLLGQNREILHPDPQITVKYDDIRWSSTAIMQGSRRVFISEDGDVLAFHLSHTTHVVLEQMLSGRTVELERKKYHVESVADLDNQSAKIFDEIAKRREEADAIATEIIVQYAKAVDAGVV